MFEVNHERGLLLSEIADGVSIQDIKAATGCSFQVFISTCKSLHGMDPSLELTMAWAAGGLNCYNYCEPQT